MSKKVLILSILAVFMLLAISFASTVSSNTSTPIRKESPLFNFRTRKAIREKVGNFITKFIGERKFFLPFQWLRDRDNLPLRFYFRGKDTEYDWTCPNHWTCESTILCECTIHCDL